MNKKQKETAAWLLHTMIKDSGYDYSSIRGEIFYRGEQDPLSDQRILSIISNEVNRKSDWRKIAQDLIDSQSDEDSPKEFILVQCDSLHWYVIPSDREDDWNKCLKLLKLGKVSPCPLPDYAKSVGFYHDPSHVKFQNYRIE